MFSLYAVEAPASARVTAVRAGLGDVVEAGTVLFELESEGEAKRLAEARAYHDALQLQRGALTAQQGAGTRALAQADEAGVASLEEARARSEEAEAPAQFAEALGLAPAPAWTAWMFAMFSARAFGFAYGSILTFRDPVRHRSWITAMIGVQAIDWIATVAFIAAGTITVAQATTAAFMPVLFIAGLVWGYPRRAALSSPGAERRPELAETGH